MLAPVTEASRISGLNIVRGYFSLAQSLAWVSGIVILQVATKGSRPLLPCSYVVRTRSFPTMAAEEESTEGLCGIILRAYLGSDLHHFYPHSISLNPGTRPHLGESGKGRG